MSLGLNIALEVPSIRRPFRRWATAGLGALLGVSVACAETAAVDVVSTTSPVTALTQAVLKDSGLSVTGIVGPGVDPHDYDASPEDVKRIGAAKLVLRGGLGV